jgi:hypothetical protein
MSNAGLIVITDYSHRDASALEILRLCLLAHNTSKYLFVGSNVRELIF